MYSKKISLWALLALALLVSAFGFVPDAQAQMMAGTTADVTPANPSGSATVQVAPPVTLTACEQELAQQNATGVPNLARLQAVCGQQNADTVRCVNQWTAMSASQRQQRFRNLQEFLNSCVPGGWHPVHQQVVVRLICEGDSHRVEATPGHPAHCECNTGFHDQTFTAQLRGRRSMGVTHVCVSNVFIENSQVSCRAAVRQRLGDEIGEYTCPQGFVFVQGQIDELRQSRDETCRVPQRDANDALMYDAAGVQLFTINCVEFNRLAIAGYDLSIENQNHITNHELTPHAVAQDGRNGKDGRIFDGEIDLHGYGTGRFDGAPSVGGGGIAVGVGINLTESVSIHIHALGGLGYTGAGRGASGDNGLHSMGGARLYASIFLAGDHVKYLSGELTLRFDVGLIARGYVASGVECIANGLCGDGRGWEVGGLVGLTASFHQNFGAFAHLTVTGTYVNWPSSLCANGLCESTGAGVGGEGGLRVSFKPTAAANNNVPSETNNVRHLRPRRKATDIQQAMRKAA